MVGNANPTTAIMIGNHSKKKYESHHGNNRSLNASGRTKNAVQGVYCNVVNIVKRMSHMIVIKFLHLLSLSIWIGAMVFFSFLVAPAIFKKLPRETAGDVVGEIFPKYWLLGYATCVTAVLTLVIMSAHERIMLGARMVLLLLMTGAVLYNGLVVAEKARRIKAEIRVAGQQEEKDRLRGRFKRLHAISSALNMLSLSLGVVLIFLTSMELR